MGRSPCCDKVGLKKGPWTPEEDQKLLAYIEEHGHGSWRALPTKAGLQRCGKSCRLRWTNYLRSDIKRGKFSLQEEQTIIQLHALLGNRWSAIATHLAKRTDNEIKNYWNTHLKKRLAKMGIDPITHKPKNDALLSSTNGSQTKNASNLSHMAQWESARLEAEARLVRESKLRSHKTLFQQHLPNPPSNFASSSSWTNNIAMWSKPTDQGITSTLRSDLESPTSTLTTFSENTNNNAPPVTNTSTSLRGETSIMPIFELVGSSASNNSEIDHITKEEGEHGWKSFENSSNSLNDDHYKLQGFENSLSFSTSTNFQDMSISMEDNNVMAEEGFTSLLLNGSDERSLSDGGGGGTDSDGGGSDHYYEDNKNYWNSILNLVNSSPSNSPMF